MKDLVTSHPMQATRPDPIPVERLLLGRPVAEAVALLPRLFNLCAAAQRVGICMALDLPVTEDDLTALRSEIRRAHALQLGVLLPRALGISPHPAPLELASAAIEADTINAFLKADTYLSSLLRAVDQRFGAAVAVAPTLPQPTPDTFFSDARVENSIAGQQADAPLMRDAERRSGRGPLWRVLGLALALTEGRDLPQTKPRQGVAIVPAARGLYGLEAHAKRGRLTAFSRVTPTDHMLAPGGALAQSLASCPPEDAALLLAIFDPCEPLTLKEAAHA